MLWYEIVILATAWLFSLFWGAVIVTELATKKIASRFGVMKVKNPDGATIYAPLGPDGEPIKVILGVDEKTKTAIYGYAPLAYSMPYMAGMMAKDFLSSQLYGKAGRMKRTLEDGVIEGMPMDQAAWAMAVRDFSHGRIGQGFLKLLIPKIQDTIARQINMSGGAGQSGGGDYKPGL